MVGLLGELNYRYGGELFHISYVSPYEESSRSVWLKDIGVTGGFRAEQPLPLNLLLSGEVKFTRYIHREDPGITVYDLYKAATPNTLTLKFGLGYQF